MHDDQIKSMRMDRNKAVESRDATGGEIGRNADFSEDPLSRALQTSIGKKLLRMFDRYRRQLRVFCWLIVVVLSFLLVLDVASLKSAGFNEFSPFIKVVSIAVFTSIVVIFLFVTQVLFIVIIGLKRTPHRTLRPFRDSISALIYTPLIAFPIWFSVVFVLLGAVGTGLSSLSGKEHVFFYLLPPIAVVVFFSLAAQIWRKSKVQLWEWQLGLVITLCVVTGLSSIVWASYNYGLKTWTEYRSALGVSGLGFTVTSILLLFLILFTWSLGIAIYLLQYAPKHTKDVEPKKHSVAAGKFLSSARSLSLLLLLLCFVFYQMAELYHNEIALQLEARDLFARALAYEFLHSKLPGGYYESEPTFEKLLGKDVERERPPGPIFPQAPQVYLTKDSGSQVEWLRVGSLELKDAHEFVSAELSLGRLIPEYDPDQLYKINAAVRVQTRWKDGTTWESYLQPPLAEPKNLFFALNYLKNWKWLKFNEEFASRFAELARKVGESFRVPSGPNPSEIELEYWAMESRLRKLSVNIPAVGIDVQLTKGMWIVMAFIVSVLVSFQNRLRYVLRDSMHGLGEPWLVIDANTRIERLIAYLWITGIWAAPWIANFYLLSMLTSQGAAGTTIALSPAILRGVGIVLSLGIGGWCSLSITILILWLRMLRRKQIE